MTAVREGCAEAVTGALDGAQTYPCAGRGRHMDTWLCGEVHVLYIKHCILSEPPAIGSCFGVRLPSDGGKGTVRAGSFDVVDPEAPFAQNHRSGYRTVYDLGELERSVFMIVTGQSGNPLFSHYRVCRAQTGRLSPPDVDRDGTGGAGRARNPDPAPLAEPGERGIPYAPLRSAACCTSSLRWPAHTGMWQTAGP